MKFSRSFQKSSEVFGSFRKFTKFSDAFGCVRMCSNSSWLKENRKPKRNDWTQNIHFYDVLRSCIKTELATPHPTDRNKTKKQSMSKMKVQVMTIHSVQKSSKTELSSRGKRPFKVFAILRFWLFFCRHRH